MVRNIPNSGVKPPNHVRGLDVSGGTTRVDRPCGRSPRFMRAMHCAFPAATTVSGAPIHGSQGWETFMAIGQGARVRVHNLRRAQVEDGSQWPDYTRSWKRATTQEGRIFVW
jgi:hypothetical protein